MNELMIVKRAIIDIIILYIWMTTLFSRKCDRFWQTKTPQSAHTHQRTWQSTTAAAVTVCVWVCVCRLTNYSRQIVRYLSWVKITSQIVLFVASFIICCQNINLLNFHHTKVHMHKHMHKPNILDNIVCEKNGSKSVQNYKKWVAVTATTYTLATK